MRTFAPVPRYPAGIMSCWACQKARIIWPPLRYTASTSSWPRVLVRMVAAMAHTSAAPTGGNNENFTQRSRRFLSDVCACTWSLITDHQQRMIRPSLLVLSSGRGLIDLLVRAWTNTAYNEQPGSVQTCAREGAPPI